MLVMRKDNHYDYVSDFMADSLINSRQIVKFKRNTEWVNVGGAPTRCCKRDMLSNRKNRLAINDSIFVRADRNAGK